MGSKISIDKHVSSLEDILDMSPYYFSKVKFENKIPDNITQHIKVSLLPHLKLKFSSFIADLAILRRGQKK